MPSEPHADYEEKDRRRLRILAALMGSRFAFEWGIRPTNYRYDREVEEIQAQKEN